MRYGVNTSLVVMIVIIGAILVTMLLPLFVKAKTGSGSSCLSNVKQCLVAQLSYAEDNDNRLPVSSKWMDSIEKHLKNPTVLRCPQIVNGNGNQYGYAMNRAMSRCQIQSFLEPSKAPVVFDSVHLKRNATTAFLDFPDPKGRPTNVGYLDGHARKKRS